MFFKCTFFFRSGYTGWTESYYCSSGVPTDALVKARDLANKRIALCGDKVDLPHVRVSDIAVRGDAVLDGQPGFTTSTDSPTLIQTKNATPGAKADVSWTSAIISLSKGGYVQGRIFARGIADDLFTGERNFMPDHTWKAMFLTYALTLAAPNNGWGVFRKPRMTKENSWPIAEAVWLQGTDLRLTVGGGFVTQPKKVIAVRGLKSSAGRLSGDFVVVDWTAPHLTLAKTFKNGPIVFEPNTGTVQDATPAFVTELKATWDTVATSRRSGRPFGSQVGRRKLQPQLR